MLAWFLFGLFALFWYIYYTVVMGIDIPAVKNKVIQQQLRTGIVNRGFILPGVVLSQSASFIVYPRVNFLSLCQKC